MAIRKRKAGAKDCCPDLLRFCRRAPEVAGQAMPYYQFDNFLAVTSRTLNLNIESLVLMPKGHLDAGICCC
jgi:hypothetical protein